MNIRERRDEILRLLDEKDYITVEELALGLGVSLVTIRSDLANLEQKGVLKRTHGGAKLVEKKSLSRLISKTIFEFEKEKDAISRFAATFVEEGNTVIIDTGSTTFHVAKYLSGKGVTMVTGSLLAIESVMEDESIEVLVLGGMLRRYSKGSIGTFACNELGQINADILFMGASGYTSSNLYCSNVIEAETKRAMIRSAGMVCLLADSSKAGKKAFASICSWSDIDVFVCDRISDELRKELEGQGVRIFITE